MDDGSKRTVTLLINQLTGSGGAEVSTLQLLRRLSVVPDLSVRAVTLRGHEEVADRPALEAAGVTFVEIGGGRVTQLRGLLRELRSHRPDVLHTTLVEADLLGRIAALLLGLDVMCSLVNTQYDPAARSLLARPWRLEVVRWIDGFLARRAVRVFHSLTNATTEHAVRFLGIDRERTVVIGRGRDLARFHPDRSHRDAIRGELGLQADQDLIVAVGRQDPQKGHADLLDALAWVRSGGRNAVLALAGRDGACTPAIDRQSARLGLDPWVRKLGIRSDVEDLVASADLYACASYFEGWGGAVVEAMAVGAPIVAYDIAPVREILHGSGVLVEVGDEVALARSIDALLGDPERARQLGRDARAAAEAHHGIEGAAEMMVDLYHDLLGPTPPWPRPRLIRWRRALRRRSETRTPKPTTSTPERLSVLHVLPALTLVGGAERSILEVIPSLRDRGIDAEIACFSVARPEDHEAAAAVGAAVHVIRSTSFRGRVKELRALVRRLQPDVVHTTLFEADMVGRAALIGLPPVLVGSLVSTNYEPLRREDPMYSRLRIGLGRFIDGATARLWVDHLHANSKAAATSAERAIHVRPSQVTIAFRGRSTDRLGVATAERRDRARSALGIAEGQPLLLAVGREEFQKGHLDLVAALPLIRASHPDAVLVIAGRPGTMSEAVTAAVIEHGLQRAVRVLGHRDDVPDLMVGADALVFPSLLEGLPGTLIEALALGTPIVATDIPPNREVVGDDAALLVPIHDPARIAEAVLHLLAHPEVRASLTEAGRVRFREHFTLDRSADAMAVLYWGLVAPQHPFTPNSIPSAPTPRD